MEIFSSRELQSLERGSINFTLQMISSQQARQSRLDISESRPGQALSYLFARSAAGRCWSEASILVISFPATCIVLASMQGSGSWCHLPSSLPCRFPQTGLKINQWHAVSSRHPSCQGAVEHRGGRRAVGLTQCVALGQHEGCISRPLLD